MRVIHQAVVAGILGLALGGCGPLSSPMPPRLNDHDQQEADDSWNSAFTPADRLDRQTVLDAFLVSQAYQTGVDRLTMRSEKKLECGLLIMEIRFDRAKPDADRFEVTLFNAAGQPIRHELYSRADIERTESELSPPGPLAGATEREQREWALKNEMAKKRLETVTDLLPKWDKGKKN